MNPLYIVIETSARCYASCPGCFREFVKGPRDGDMTKEIFEAAVRDLPKGTMCLPAFHGEALLHPDFEHFLRRYKDLGLRVSIPTSGFAGARHIPALVGENSPVYVLIISVDGYHSYSHELRRGRITLSRAEDFVEKCLEARGSRPIPWIAVRWVEGGQSEKEFELYLKKWLFEKRLDMILRSRMFTYGSGFNSPPLGEVCHSLREGNPVVLFNGDVLLCERVPDRERYVLGNVLRDPWPMIMSRREKYLAVYPREEPCRLCSAAYLLAGMKGVMYLRHPDDCQQEVPIYWHSDHSQSFYALRQEWSGINWGLK